MDPRALRKLLRRFPAAVQLDSTFARYRGVVRKKRELVNTELWDEILQRVSPYLRRNPPLDILDLWPGCGVGSSKINELLKPRRHVLVQPDDKFDAILKPLAESKPCYKLLTEPIYGKRDWPTFIETHLPEQGSPTQKQPGQILKNDTLLVLANPPLSGSSKDHFTPARWWLKFLEDSMMQQGLNINGTARVLLMCPHSELPAMLPRTAADRKRIGALTEAVSLHAIEVASSNEYEPYHSWHGWDSIQASRKQVAERATAQHIVTPPNRELPPLEMVPEIVRQGRNASPYTPRVCLPAHRDILETIAAGDATGIEAASGVKDPTIKKLLLARNSAVTKLTQDNKAAYTRVTLAQMTLELDETTRRLARAAADLNETPDSLQALDDRIRSLQSSVATELSGNHYTMTKHYDNLVDDGRLAYSSNHTGDCSMIRDRRPFEPLLIEPHEIWPTGNPAGIVYLETHQTPPALQKIYQLPNWRNVLERFHSLTSILGTRGTMTAADLRELIFPHLLTNELVRVIPRLSAFANKRIKPGSGPLPLSDPTLDPTTSYQENLEYDLSDVRLRILSVETMVDIVIEYEKLENKLHEHAFSRLLGGSMTVAQVGDEFTFNVKR